MLDTLYTESMEIKRSVDGDDDKIVFETLEEDVPCHTQPLDDSISQDLEGGFGKEKLLVTAYEGLEEGDRVIIDEKEYRVTGVEFLDFLGNSHTEARIRIFES